MSLRHNLRVKRAKSLNNTLKEFESLRPSLQDTKVMGRKKQRSRNEKLDRLQMNLTGSESGRARQSWNYYPDEKQAYLS